MSQNPNGDHIKKSFFLSSELNKNFFVSFNFFLFFRTTASTSAKSSLKIRIMGPRTIPSWKNLCQFLIRIKLLIKIGFFKQLGQKKICLTIPSDLSNTATSTKAWLAAKAPSLVAHPSKFHSPCVEASAFVHPFTSSTDRGFSLTICPSSQSSNKSWWQTNSLTPISMNKFKTSRA